MPVGVDGAVAALHFHQHGLGAARPILQVVHRVGGHQLAFVDDDHLLAGLLDLGQDVRAQDDGVVARQAADQITRFVDLLGIQAGRRFVENQDFRVVDDRLRQPNALPVAFGKLAEQLVRNVGDGAALAHFVQRASPGWRPAIPFNFPTKVRYSRTSISG